MSRKFFPALYSILFVSSTSRFSSVTSKSFADGSWLDLQRTGELLRNNKMVSQKEQVEGLFGNVEWSLFFSLQYSYARFSFPFAVGSFSDMINVNPFDQPGALKKEPFLCACIGFRVQVRLILGFQLSVTRKTGKQYAMTYEMAIIKNSCKSGMLYPVRVTHRFHPSISHCLILSFVLDSRDRKSMMTLVFALS